MAMRLSSMAEASESTRDVTVRAGALVVQRGNAVPLVGWARDPTPSWCELQKRAGTLHMEVWQSQEERERGTPVIDSIPILPDLVYKIDGGFAIQCLGLGRNARTTFTSPDSGAETEAWFAAVQTTMRLTHANLETMGESGVLSPHVLSSSVFSGLKAINRPMMRFVHEVCFGALRSASECVCALLSASCVRWRRSSERF